MRTRALLAGFVAAAIASTASPARAADPEDPYDTLSLVTPHPKHYLTGGLEIGAVLGLGFVDYLAETTTRGGTFRPGEVRWGLRYDWPTLRDKLIGTGLNLDANQFATNYASHPVAGTLYYSAARTNHLSFAESYLGAVLGSTTWEYFGEIRELASVNDLVTTPVSGTSIGEPLIQLSGFFQRRPRTPVNRVLAIVFSPANAFNTWIDEAEPRPFAEEPWHRFVLAAGPGVTVQDGAAYADERASLAMSLVQLPGWERPAREQHLFDDGNVSSVAVDLGWSSGHLVNALFATRVVPVGVYARQAGERGGAGGFIGMRMSFEYGTHDWDRDRPRPMDVGAIVSPLGFAAEWSYARGALSLHTGLDVFGSLAGVTPYALPVYLRGHDDAALLTPIREHAYYHAAGVSVASRVELAWRRARLAADLRFDAFRALEGLDENEATVDAGLRIADRRTSLHASLGVPLPIAGLEVSVEGRRALRSGEIGAASASRGETSWWATLGVSF